jgi:hypothetical protein
MKSKFHSLKPRIIKLRKTGKSYGEIRKILNLPIPKSTLSNWCSSINLPNNYQKRIKQITSKNAVRGRALALIVNKEKREEYIKSVKKRVRHLSDEIKDKNTAKIALAMLYLGEGGKSQKGSLMFGKSDPDTIQIFLKLLRYCYPIDETKFRCTLQCRADQNIRKLERFWTKVTQIPLPQFYKARIDPRTIGKPSKKPKYKGVCRIDYFSGYIFMEIKKIIEVIKEGR